MSTLADRLGGAPLRHQAPPHRVLAAPERAQGLLGACRVMLAAWSRRRRDRETLARMSQRELQDIGLSRTDAAIECGKPFWRS